jgi:hypothetical protein
MKTSHITKAHVQVEKEIFHQKGIQIEKNSMPFHQPLSRFHIS